ncbi:mitochondrial 54S ribosomal protein bL31m [Apiospora aurea]|uniref:Ribosomal protein bL31m N-terminal domain-containing protein n=1 Tax=Apiospora aurea TaxID=335848 RepID=A0ABR1QL50_9PEZI
MASRLPTALPRRPTTSTLSTFNTLAPQTTSSSIIPTLQQTQTRNATLIKRPKRPYTFTQVIQLSDGSTFTMRTCSPHSLYKSTKDTRNHVMWNPSEKSLKNIEVDEAGKLAAFRERYGRGWDAQAPEVQDGGEGAQAAAAGGAAGGKKDGKKDDKAAADASFENKFDSSYDPLGDLISQYAVGVPEDKGAKVAKPKKK